ncbi:MAG: DctP family TRAP transporter solute-binding subunit [Pseudomonadota bacterium]
MKKICMYVVIGMILSVIVVVPAAAQKFTCKISLIHAEDLYKDSGYPAAVVFKNIVEANTGGDIKVSIYPNSQLGNETEAMEGLQTGAIQIACPSIGATTKFVPDFFALNIPFMFFSHREAWDFYDSDFVANVMKGTIKSKGIRFIGQTDDGGGFVVLTNSKKTIKTPADLKGIKMRDIEQEGRLMFWRALGVSATPIPWEELYSALQTGVVDGQSNGVGIISWAKLWEVQKYATALGHYYGSLQWFVSEKWFQSLPEKYRKVVLNAMEEAKWAGRGIVRVKNIVGYEELTKAGMQVYFPTNDEKESFRKIGQPAYIQWVKKKLNNDLVDKALAEVQKIRNQ